MSCDWTVRASGYLDRELSEPEKRQFEEHLAGCAECAAELEELKSMQRVTGSLKLREFPDETWDRYWENTYNRLERGFGWIFLSIGAMILLAAGVYELLVYLLDDTVSPWWIRLATGFFSLGLAALFVSVLRERIFVRKQDPYREVKR